MKWMFVMCINQIMEITSSVSVLLFFLGREYVYCNENVSLNCFECTMYVVYRRRWMHNPMLSSCVLCIHHWDRSLNQSKCVFAQLPKQKSHSKCNYQLCWFFLFSSVVRRVQRCQRYVNDSNEGDKCSPKTDGILNVYLHLVSFTTIYNYITQMSTSMKSNW